MKVIKMAVNSISAFFSFFVILLLPISLAAQQENVSNAPMPASMLNDQGNEISPVSKQLTFETLPVPVERTEPRRYTLPNGEPHWYEVVFLPEGGVNWVQAKSLAEQAGGYLVSIHSEQENEFVFSLVRDPKFWYKFDHGEGLYNLSGPFLGGFQADGAPEPDGGWHWASGEPMTYERWQKEGLPIGEKIKPDNQPNNNRGIQNVMAFGEVDVPMNYWSDVPHIMGTYNSGLPQCYGFIIEYDQTPI